MNRVHSMRTLCCAALLASVVAFAQEETALSAAEARETPPEQLASPQPQAALESPVEDGLASPAAVEINEDAVEEIAVAVVPTGDAERGRLVFGACRTCHYAEKSMGHNNGPGLHRIFGKVVGKQEGFAYYSEEFKAAQFVWTPELMYVWLENPMAMFPSSSMMSLGVPDPQQRADLIAFLKQASVREP